ncbi:hypothetical protein ACE38W_00650 [Chitinophaga sp. Hz27]|uniref:hypothetical protein n=1 Tax=Chitinophaga sp. Hz27 TaxID=3347169 RepID=UPI0035D761D1
MDTVLQHTSLKKIGTSNLNKYIAAAAKAGMKMNFCIQSKKLIYVSIKNTFKGQVNFILLKRLSVKRCRASSERSFGFSLVDEEEA